MSLTVFSSPKLKDVISIAPRLCYLQPAFMFQDNAIESESVPVSGSNDLSSEVTARFGSRTLEQKCSKAAVT
ncbi:hypothetical protein TNCT_428111 [Trichonephila clavata]|uniref:Uncharacterized protein n=1 Tax=Trichonephila clavata TaxID=2740835 RepID=A0A8X6HLG2_TRICU|nr:hypothetical protein TNCT_428111 [Trichonephila clavata]